MDMHTIAFAVLGLAPLVGGAELLVRPDLHSMIAMMPVTGFTVCFLVSVLRLPTENGAA
jgi:hypothetical protein